jgi:hypothetical protein
MRIHLLLGYAAFAAAYPAFGDSTLPNKDSSHSQSQMVESTKRLSPEQNNAAIINSPFNGNNGKLSNSPNSQPESYRVLGASTNEVRDESDTTSALPILLRSIPLEEYMHTLKSLLRATLTRNDVSRTTTVSSVSPQLETPNINKIVEKSIKDSLNFLDFVGSKILSSPVSIVNALQMNRAAASCCQ